MGGPGSGRRPGGGSKGKGTGEKTTKGVPAWKAKGYATKIAYKNQMASIKGARARNKAWDKK
jgi:hypothetical protein